MPENESITPKMLQNSNCASSTETIIAMIRPKIRVITPITINPVLTLELLVSRKSNRLDTRNPTHTSVPHTIGISFEFVTPISTIII